MIQRLFEEQCSVECPFAAVEELNRLNRLILGVVERYLSRERLDADELAALLDNCLVLENASKRLDGESRFYAEQTVDLGNMVMSGAHVPPARKRVYACRIAA